MKKSIIITVFFLCCITDTFSQTGSDFEKFNNNVLPAYSNYFEKALLSESGKLQLFAGAQYLALNQTQQKTIMQELFSMWNDSLILIYHGTIAEVWGWDSQNRSFNMIDQMNPEILPKSGDEIVIGRPKPFFLYFGGLITLNDQKILNLAINTRAGFYLLMNRWDLALTLSAGRTGNIELTSTGYANIGIASRVHFPIRKTGIVPHIGIELAYSSFGQTNTGFAPSFILGLSWFVGIGSINIGINMGETINGAGGLTVFPNAKHLRR